MTVIARITNDATNQRQIPTITAEAGLEMILPTDESDTAKTMTASDHVALARIAMTIDETIRARNPVIQRRMQSIPARVAPDMIVTRITEAIDRRNDARLPRNAAFAKLPSAPRSSKSSKTVFWKKSKAQQNVRLLQSS